MSESVSVPVLARMEAAKRLVRVSNEGAFASLVTGDRNAAVERAASGWVGGVTRWRLWLDHLISQSYTGKLDDMEALLRELLRIGAYDLAVAGVKPHAAVNEAVEAARKLLRPGAARLANAVLRGIDRKRESWGSWDEREDAKSMAVRWSHPEWLVDRWLARFGPSDTRALLDYNNRAPQYSVRATRDRDGLEAFLASHHVGWEPSPFLDDYLRVERLQPLVRDGWLAKGACVVQDESAGLVVRLLAPEQGETVVDACAAPGGKSRYIAERLGPVGHLIAVDSSKARLRLLDDLVEGEGAEDLPTIHRVAADFRDWAEQRVSAGKAGADRVLVDAPCSGLGVLASRADLRWRRTADDFARLGPIQAGLLDAAADCVRPGGVLVYATCSIAPEENEEQVQGFLSCRPDFEVDGVSGLVPDEMITPEGFYASLPQRDGIDGAFGARLRKRAD